jgi:hypothetical protein
LTGIPNQISTYRQISKPDRKRTGKPLGELRLDIRPDGLVGRVLTGKICYIMGVYKFLYNIEKIILALLIHD